MERGHANPGLDLCRVFLLAGLLPIALFLVDKWAIGTAAQGGTTWVMPYMLLVGQVALVAWTVGRWLPHPVLCWAVYLWVLALIDLWALTLAYPSGLWGVCDYGLISAQVGLIAVWAILGMGPWQWRLPAIAVIAAIFGYHILPSAK